MKNDLLAVYAQLKATIEGAEEDLNKFVSGNDSAGVRVRKAMQETKNLAQNIRNQVTDLKAAN